jgi:outer membrane protein assembly factor BamD
MIRLPVIFLALLASGCGGASKVTRQDKKEVKKVSSLAQARKDYIEGLSALVAGEFDSAREHLEKVSRGPAYVVYTPLAKIRLADASMLEEKFEEAAEQYKDFIESNATDPNLHYVYFRLAQALTMTMPKEFFLLPPPDRRDQKPVREALSAVNDFLQNFPNSPYCLEAKAMRDSLVKIVCSYELEVARFYLTRKKPIAARNRVERLFEEIPESKGLEEASYLLAKALAMAQDRDSLSKECERYRTIFEHGRFRSLMKGLCSYSVGTNTEVQR